GAITLSPSNIKDGILDINKVTYISWFKYEESPEIKIYNGDILLVKTGSTYGKTTFVKNLRELATINPQIIVLKKIKCDPEFLGFIMKSPWIQNQIESTIVGGAIPTLSQEQVSKFIFPLPPLPEQTAIANALSDMDALIAQTEKLIEKKKASKQGVMQELLKPKEGWVTKKLGEIGEISGSGVDKKIVEGELPVRLVNYLDVYKRDFIYSNELSHWVTAPHLKSNFCKVKAGDLFFTPSSETREDIALAAVAMEDIDDAVYSYHVVRARINADWDLRFKAYVFSTKHFLQQAETLCEGSGKRYVLTLPKFRSLEVSFPSSKSEQKSISNTLWDIDSEIWNYQSKLQKLKLQKQGMMQALLTGKIRLI
ncbi:MAG: restriction endonuclease subunit S, partial [Chitinophagia bacterium]|nr:restriction endonuclease subunit S [Chitinophagia bacterium]